MCECMRVCVCGGGGGRACGVCVCVRVCVRVCAGVCVSMDGCTRASICVRKCVPLHILRTCLRWFLSSPS